MDLPQNGHQSLVVSHKEIDVRLNFIAKFKDEVKIVNIPRSDCPSADDLGVLTLPLTLLL